MTCSTSRRKRGCIEMVTPDQIIKGGLELVGGVLKIKQGEKVTATSAGKGRALQGTALDLLHARGSAGPDARSHRWQEGRARQSSEHFDQVQRCRMASLEATRVTYI